MVKNNVSINFLTSLKSASNWSKAVSFKKTLKSVSDTGNPYHVASLNLLRLNSLHLTDPLSQ